MHATIRRYEVLPQDVPTLRERVREGFLPIVRAIPGFVAYDLIEAENGVVISVSVFEAEAGTAESTRRAAEWVDQAAADVIHQARQVTSGEVVIHEGAAPPAP